MGEELDAERENGEVAGFVGEDVDDFKPVDVGIRAPMAASRVDTLAY